MQHEVNSKLTYSCFSSCNIQHWLLKSSKRQHVWRGSAPYGGTVVKMMPQDVCFKSPISEAVGQRRTTSKAKRPDVKNQTQTQLPNIIRSHHNPAKCKVWNPLVTSYTNLRTVMICLHFGVFSSRPSSQYKLYATPQPFCKIT